MGGYEFVLRAMLMLFGLLLVLVGLDSYRKTDGDWVPMAVMVFGGLAVVVSTQGVN